MTPVGLSSGMYPSALAGMRPEMPMRKPLTGPEADPVGFPHKSASAPGAIQGPGQFDNVLGTLVKEVNTKQMAASDKVTGLLSGQNVPLHQAMIAMEEASVSFQLMVEVRNKLLEGYQELMRLQM